MTTRLTTNPFNSALEAGVRSLALLTGAFPNYLDLEQLAEFDYLTVHSSDLGGPPSLHAPVPSRSGELLVRRGLIERGLLLLMSKGLAGRLANENGFLFYATDAAAPFLDSLTSIYLVELRQRADWTLRKYGNNTAAELRAQTRHLLTDWSSLFAGARIPGTPAQ